MRFLVLGASGLVGSHVLAEARERGHEVTGTCRTSDVAGLERLDLADHPALTHLLDRVHPDVVVHAAGWSWVDGCERDPARSRLENAEQPLYAARWCRENGARLLYYSTSYVFDGAKGDYDEADAPRPLNVYGKDKLLAEEELARVLGDRLLVARLICVWGREAARKNFVYQVARAAEESRPLRLPSDQMGNPTWAGDIAFWSVRLLEAGESGVWHLAGDRPDVSRVEWALAILDGLRVAGRPCVAPIDVVPTAALGSAPRPLRAGLCTAKVQMRWPRACRHPASLSPEIS